MLLVKCLYVYTAVALAVVPDRWGVLGQILFSSGQTAKEANDWVEDSVMEKEERDETERRNQRQRSNALITAFYLSPLAVRLLALIAK